MLKQIGLKEGYLLAPLSSVSSVASVDSAFIDYISSAVNFGAGEYFYLTITELDLIEQVKVIDVGANYIVIVRGPDPQTFTAAATYNTALNTAAVADLVATVAPAPTFNLTGAGVVTVESTGGGNFLITVPQPDIIGVSGVEVTAAFPEYQVGLIANGNCCGGDDETGGDGSTQISGSGIATAELSGDTWVVGVAAPTFNGVGVTITGAWPTYTFTVDASGAGTVTSVSVGAGLSITGNPAVNPTISIPNSGVSAGAYGDIVVNARGFITSIAAGFNPISEIEVVADSGLAVSRTAGVVTLNGIAAAEGIVGVVALADADVALDPADVTTAVTPKLLATVIADLQGTEAFGGQVYSGEADADYSNVVPTTAVALVLDTGERALIMANIHVQDTAAPTVAQLYGVAIFSATGTRIVSNKKMTQSGQSIMFLLDGPFNDGIVLRTTALTGTMSVISQSLVALTF